MNKACFKESCICFECIRSDCVCFYSPCSDRGMCSFNSIDKCSCSEDFYKITMECLDFVCKDTGIKTECGSRKELFE